MCYNLRGSGASLIRNAGSENSGAVSERLGTAESRYQAGMARLTEAISNGEGENLDESLQFLRTEPCSSERPELSGYLNCRRRHAVDSTGSSTSRRPMPARRSASDRRTASAMRWRHSEPQDSASPFIAAVSEG